MTFQAGTVHVFYAAVFWQKFLKFWKYRSSPNRSPCVELLTARDQLQALVGEATRSVSVHFKENARSYAHFLLNFSCYPKLETCYSKFNFTYFEKEWRFFPP